MPDRTISRRTGLLCAAALFLLSFLLFRAAGMRMEIPWTYFQLLDRQALTTHPWQSIWLLHSQPPLLNLLLAGIIRFGQWTACSPELLAGGLFMLLGLTTTLLLAATARRLTDSAWLSLLATVLLVADPGFQLFLRLFFYPALLVSLSAALVYCTVRYLADGKTRWLLAVSVAAGLTTNLRSLYPPLWAALIFGLLVFLRRVASGGTPDATSRTKRPPLPRACLWPALLLLLLLTAWPLKNKLLFGQATWSSWSGYNLARGTDAINTYFADKDPRHFADAPLRRFLDEHAFAAPEVIAAWDKSDGSMNWNHYRFLVMNPSLKVLALRWRMSHPQEWFVMSLKNYFLWSRAPFADPYSSRLRGPETPAYTAYATAVRGVLCADLGPWLARHAGWLDSQGLYLDSPVLPAPLFGLLWFPSLMLASVWFCVDGFRHGRPREAGMLLLMLFCVAWTLVLPCLTDGHEGNRMRLAVTPCLVLMPALLVGRLVRRK